ncbi:MAG: hotdog fold thioesterase [Paludibacteraceae bacterium]|nr:hotdog fold thioesterase [Paludibacteraceae bacterium]MBP3716797.1 hotdog fold thioesterase [Paludibacteraceae bacterium]MBR6103918.1 hotdog fold thioesterase [Paludibacteraceae bacterium]
MTLLERLNRDDRFASGIGARLTEIREGYARAELTVAEQHLNAAGVCQGGVLYTLADLSFAGVANCHGILSLGISNTITFIKSAQLGDHLVAECVETVNHYKLPYCDIKVKNQKGEILATCTGLAYRLKKEMDFDNLM